MNLKAICFIIDFDREASLGNSASTMIVKQKYILRELMAHNNYILGCHVNFKSLSRHPIMAPGLDHFLNDSPSMCTHSHISTKRSKMKSP